MGRCGEAVY
jgi:hypothetical protein